MNPNLRVRDQLKCPANSDLRHVLSLLHGMPGQSFSLLADVSKAHRRYLHRQRDWGLMACRIQGSSDIWLNKVGTFGLGCASYWWGRLFSIMTRTAISLALRDPVFQFLFADDLNLLASGAQGMRAMVVMLYFFGLVGTPFTWLKVRGGFQMDWIGYHIDLNTHALGISEDRARWLTDWIDTALAAGTVLVRDLVAVVGRLAFTAGPLERIRPFMAPIYSWIAVVPSSACLPPPVMVKLALKWVSLRLKRGGRMMLCRPIPDSTPELFRTDAKAEEGVIRIGGWETRHTRVTRDARWFSIELNADNAPGSCARASLSGLSPRWSSWPPSSARLRFGRKVQDKMAW